MALATYDDLINSINGTAKWLHRSDLAAIAVDWVTLAETVMNYGDLVVLGVDGLRTGDQETAWTSTSTVPAVCVVGSAAVTLPTDFLEMRSLYLRYSGGGGRELIQRPVTPVPVGTLTQTNGIPTTYWVVGNTIVFDRPCDQAYQLVGDYYAKIGPLATQSTNWLMTKFPNVYLSGAIACGAPWMGPSFNPLPWITGFKTGMAAVRRADARKRSQNTTMRTEAARMTGNRPFDWRTGGL
jgi:hypothetical protein